MMCDRDHLDAVRRHPIDDAEREIPQKQSVYVWNPFAASGCKRIGKLATRSARQALPNHFPRYAFHRPGLNLLGSPVNFHAPSLLNALLDISVETSYEYPNEICSIRIIEGESLLNYFFVGYGHE